MSGCFSFLEAAVQRVGDGLIYLSVFVSDFINLILKVCVVTDNCLKLCFEFLYLFVDFRVFLLSVDLGLDFIFKNFKLRL